MRKGLIFLLGIVSFLGINTVSAETNTINFSIAQLDDLYSLNNDTTLSILENKFYEVINDVLDEHNNSYYVMSLGISGDSEPYFAIYSYDTSFVNYSSFVSYNKNNDITCTYYFLQSDNSSYNIVTEYYPLIPGYGSPIPFVFSLSEYYPSNFYLSNMEIPYDSSDVVNIYDEEELVFTLNPGDIIPAYKEIINPSVNDYTSIDLNKYSYVALSLKDYSSIDTLYTNMYVKGQLCLTPVYNYGMTEKTEYYPGYQVDRCSPYYEDFTTVRTYILEQDLKNNAIYYLKSYDKTKDNIVKVDSSVFNITYITEDKKDNPYVSIGGKTYPTISYDNLSSSATKSEEEGYISGVVCQVGDFNCYVEHNPSNIFDDIFSSPLKFLEDIWASVTSIFTLITEFITLLPPMMQSFLYLSFMIAVILGLLKIIL